MVSPQVTIDPDPSGTTRKENAEKRREKATEIARDRPHVDTEHNKDLNDYHSLPTSFHKGLPHDIHGGVSREMFAAFAKGLVAGE